MIGKYNALLKRFGIAIYDCWNNGALTFVVFCRIDNPDRFYELTYQPINDKWTYPETWPDGMVLGALPILAGCAMERSTAQDSPGDVWGGGTVGHNSDFERWTAQGIRQALDYRGPTPDAVPLCPPLEEIEIASTAAVAALRTCADPEPLRAYVRLLRVQAEHYRQQSLTDGLDGHEQFYNGADAAFELIEQVLGD